MKNWLYKSEINSFLGGLEKEIGEHHTFHSNPFRANPATQIPQNYIFDA